MHFRRIWQFGFSNGGKKHLFYDEKTTESAEKKKSAESSLFACGGVSD
jgi:hypothetical protein